MGKHSIQLLDCTLRDGGYVNSWEFSEECYNDISIGLVEANVNIIELGIMGANINEQFSTKFKSLNEVPIYKKVQGVKYAMMVTTNELNRVEIPDLSDNHGPIDTIRLAFFKADSEDAIEQMKMLKSKGYKLFVQTMATFQYDDNEFINLVKRINEIEPYAFYIVDSFGMFYSRDVKHYCNMAKDYLAEEIKFGFHAHNNLQMANANTITFIEQMNERDIVVDSSIFGMGRGAGNASTELIMHYLNSLVEEPRYDEFIVWGLYDKHIKPIQNEYAWGYLPEQFLVSNYKINPAYVWYLINHGVESFDEIRNILEKVPEEKKYSLNVDCLKEIINSNM